MSTPAVAERPLPGAVGWVRWRICALLFFATTVNYMDRQVLGILKPVLTHDLGWKEENYGWVVFAFQMAYALMMPMAGRILDWLGTRVGYALAVAVWSLASMSHALARTSMQFALARFALGLGEAGNFPAAIKTVADWFPKRERALATGIFNSGSNVGAIAAPLMVPAIASHFGWRASFLATGGFDLIWLACWLLWFRQPREYRGLSAAELSLIEADGGDPPRRIPYLVLLRRREAWAILAARLLTDPVWWFYLFWLPGFLNRQFGLNLSQLGPPLIAVYLAADVGSIGGGWLSSKLLSLGWDLSRARKTAMLVCAVAVLSVVFVQYSGGNLWLTVALVGTATAAHQGWSANVYTLASDVFPRSAVGSVVGLGGLGGAVGGMLVSPVIGKWLDFSHGAYGPLFIVAGSMYLIALGIVNLLIPRIRPVAL